MIPTGNSSDKLLCAISRHGQGERLMRRAREAGAGGGAAAGSGHLYRRPAGPVLP